MGYTKFGEFVRVLRIRHHEVMGDMAKMLGTSLPFLSAVENGKKNIPAEWTEKIINYYNLTVQEKNELYEAIEESKTQYKIRTENASELQRKTVTAFARSFDEIDDDTALRILELLRNKGDKK